VKVKELFGDTFHNVWMGKPMKERNLYDYKAMQKAIRSTKATAQTVYIKNAAGQLVGARTIYQK
jgi:hypothetical protein